MINGDKLRDAYISGANNITNNKTRIDELNIFPVPDGDTGTNMSMTINNAVKELSRLKGESVSKVADTAASAFLRGARGNSGVILSLLFRGFAKGLKGKENMTGNDLIESLGLGVEAAYKAVMKPTEGTILTVARVAHEKAKEYADKDFLTVFDVALAGAKEALASTPELLPVLKKAGVVDAGGRGFVVILEGMLSVLKDGVIIANNSISASAEDSSEEAAMSAAGEFEGEITFTYCTEFIVKRDSEVTKKPAELRTFLETIGDCVVVVDDEEIIKVHVHTDHPGNAIENGLTFGQLINMKIENMRDQHEKAKHDNNNASKKKPAQNAERTETFTPVTPTKPYGFVSVCAGDGLAQLFTELGADTIVSGGQTMNPSTDDILKAIESTPAETVFVLPNNKNIIMAAEQAIPISTRKVIVLHTKTIPQGITAMLNFDPDANDEDNAIAMQNSYANLTTGQVTFAARDSDYDGHKIKKGELLALVNGKVSFTEQNLSKCMQRLVKGMVNRDSAFLTLIYGEDVTEEQANAIYAELNEKFGDKLEITLVNGGQPVYYFILSVE